MANLKAIVLKTNIIPMVTIGLLLLSSYGLILAAFTLALIGYAGAVRESSIIFGALGGWLFLDENFGARRLLGSIIIISGF